jgi:methylmalonyl-CoA mutase C-terminal domain/subunit
MHLFQRVIDLLKERDAEDIAVIGGGIIPEKDAVKLRAKGVREVFLPGTSLETIVDWVRTNIDPH